MVNVSASNVQKQSQSQRHGKRLTLSYLVHAFLVIFLVVVMGCLFWVNMMLSYPDSSSAPVDCIKNSAFVAPNSETAVHTKSGLVGVLNDSSTATVMGMATGYNVGVYKRFVGSLRRSGFKGTLNRIRHNCRGMSSLMLAILQETLSWWLPRSQHQELKSILRVRVSP